MYPQRPCRQICLKTIHLTSIAIALYLISMTPRRGCRCPRSPWPENQTGTSAKPASAPLVFGIWLRTGRIYPLVCQSWCSLPRVLPDHPSPPDLSVCGPACIRNLIVPASDSAPEKRPASPVPRSESVYLLLSSLKPYFLITYNHIVKIR